MVNHVIKHARPRGSRGLSEPRLGGMEGWRDGGMEGWRDGAPDAIPACAHWILQGPASHSMPVGVVSGRGLQRVARRGVVVFYGTAGDGLGENAKRFTQV